MGNLFVNNGGIATNKGGMPNVDLRYGPYANVHAAHTALSDDDVVTVGLTVGIAVDGNIVEYWYQGGTAEANLVPKHQGGDSGFSGDYNDLDNKPSFATVNGQRIDQGGNIAVGGTVVTGGTKQVAFSDFVQGGFTTAVNDTAGNMRSMYPLNADEVEGASCATAQLTVGVFDGSWTRLSNDTVAQGEQWSNPHAAGARYVMLTVGGSTVPTVTLTVGSHVDLMKLSDVEFCGSNLFALFAEHQLMKDPGFTNGSDTIWSKQGGTANEFANGVYGATFGRAMHLSKTGSASAWVGKLPKSGYKPTLTTGHNYMVAWRGRMNSFSREQDNSNMTNQIYETAGLDVLFLAKSVRNTITEVTDGFVNVVDTVYATDSGAKDISIGFTYGQNRNIGTFDAHVDRCDIIDLSDLYKVPTVRELQWAYRVFVMFMLGAPSDEIEALLRQRHMADADIYIPAGQARRFFLNEARKTLDEIGVTGYKYSNPSGTDNGKYGSTADYNRISCDGMARAAVQMAGHPDLLRRLAQRRTTLHALRGTTIVDLPAWANYMGGSERGANADQDADSKALGEAYEIVMGKGGNWGSSRTDSDGSGIVGNTSTAVYLCRSKKYPGRVMVGVVHFEAGDVSPYSDLINVFDQLEGKTGAAEPAALHAAAGYVPDMPSSCRYIDFLEYKKDASVAFNTASMIKFFTAVVIDRWLKPGDVVTYAPDCVLPGGSAISGKQVGDKYTYEEIMPAAMMGSDNEMFYAMATEAGRKMVLSRMDSSRID